MNLLDRIRQDLKTSLKEGDKLKANTLRFVLSNLNYAKIEKRKDLTDQETIDVIQKQAKRHQESIEIYKKASRPELADKETQELEVISVYLPAQLSEKELAAEVDKAISHFSVSTPSDMGKVMSYLVPQLKGRADGKLISQLVKEKLSNG